MSKRSVALALLAAIACFGVGVGAARWLPSSAPEPARQPQIFIDPGRVQLLPDASLHVDLPRGFEDGGTR